MDAVVGGDAGWTEVVVAAAAVDGASSRSNSTIGKNRQGPSSSQALERPHDLQRAWELAPSCECDASFCCCFSSLLDVMSILHLYNCYRMNARLPVLPLPAAAQRPANCSPRVGRRRRQKTK